MISTKVEIDELLCGPLLCNVLFLHLPHTDVVTLWDSGFTYKYLKPLFTLHSS